GGFEHYSLLPLVLRDSTAHSCRPVTKAVQLHKVLPAATECRTHAACQGISAEEYRQLDHQKQHKHFDPEGHNSCSAQERSKINLHARLTCPILGHRVGSTSRAGNPVPSQPPPREGSKLCCTSQFI